MNDDDWSLRRLRIRRCRCPQDKVGFSSCWCAMQCTTEWSWVGRESWYKIRSEKEKTDRCSVLPGFARATAFSGQPTASFPHLFAGCFERLFFKPEQRLSTAATAVKRRVLCPKPPFPSFHPTLLYMFSGWMPWHGHRLKRGKKPTAYDRGPPANWWQFGNNP